MSSENKIVEPQIKATLGLFGANWIGGAITVFLLVHLFLAVLKPEIFS